MARFFAFFTLFHLSLTFFDRMFPLNILHNDCDKVVFSHFKHFIHDSIMIFFNRRFPLTLFWYQKNIPTVGVKTI